jgi:hypothetical protein
VDKKPTVPDIIMMAGGAVCLLFSFFAFYSFASIDTSAWGSGLFPLATYVALFGLIVGGSVALTKFANVNMPEPILSFSWKQIRLALSIFAGLLMLGFLILDTGFDKAIGFWLMLLGTIALIVGSVMETIGFDPQAAKATGGAAPGAAPPSPPSPPSPPPGSPPPPPPPSA